MIKAAHSIGRHGARDAAIILLMFRHGLRTAELVSLKWSQINLNDGYIEIKRVKHGHNSIHPLRAPELRSLRQIKRDYPETQYVFISDILLRRVIIPERFRTTWGLLKKGEKREQAGGEDKKK
ncbi:MAG: tyrosine-type recombinase/integrase [Limnoraphis sp.]